METMYRDGGSAPHLSGPHPVVMVIDDSPTIRKIVEVTFGREGCQVAAFADGVAALRWLREARGPAPALCLLDITLPHMDGFEVARRFRQRPELASMRIVMLSRHAGMLDRLKARLAGADAYLIKPVYTDALLALLPMGGRV